MRVSTIMALSLLAMLAACSDQERAPGEPQAHTSIQLDLPGEAFDAVLMILTYHDIYYVDETVGWPRIVGPALLAEIHDAMRLGAVLGVVDHVAEAGAPAEVGGTLHRIDPELAKREIVAAGFVFDGANDALRNPADDHTQLVFTDGVRGKTDRFIFRFRKPGGVADGGRAR